MTELQGKIKVWQVSTWNVITVVVMLTMSIVGALWMVHLG